MSACSLLTNLLNRPWTPKLCDVGMLPPQWQPAPQAEFAALADGLGDVDESPTEQAEFAALADGLGDDGE